jgi:hypothetical protein
VEKGAATAMEEARKEAKAKGIFMGHRRGEFAAIGTGVSFGGGPKVHQSVCF